MENYKKLSKYLLQAIIHKIKTPLATIQNDIEYISNIYNTSKLKQSELTEVSTSIKKALTKITDTVDNAFFVINNQENLKSNLNLRELKNLKYIILENENEFDINIKINKLDLFNYFNLLTQILYEFNLFLPTNKALILKAIKKENSFFIISSFKNFTNANNILGKTYYNLYEYINIENHIDSINSVLADILLQNINLKSEFKSQKDLIFFKLEGFYV